MVTLIIFAAIAYGYYHLFLVNLANKKSIEPEERKQNPIERRHDSNEGRLIRLCCGDPKVANRLIMREQRKASWISREEAAQNAIDELNYDRRTR